MRPFLVSEVKVTSNHLITPRQALPVTHLTSASINPHAPHFIFRVAKEAMEKKFGHVWQSVGATKVPTFAKEKPLGAKKGKSRRGGLLPRRLPNVKRVQVQQDEEEEEVARRDSDMSIDSDSLE